MCKDDYVIIQLLAFASLQAKLRCLVLNTNQDIFNGLMKITFFERLLPCIVSVWFSITDFYNVGAITINRKGRDSSTPRTAFLSCIKTLYWINKYVIKLHISRLFNICSSILQPSLKMFFFIILSSVADPFYFDMDPDHGNGSGSGWQTWNRSKRIRIRNTDFKHSIA